MDVDENDNLMTLSFNRDMPNMEGLGYRQVNTNEDSTKSWYLFDYLNTEEPAELASSCCCILS